MTKQSTLDYAGSCIQSAQKASSLATKYLETNIPEPASILGYGRLVFDGQKHGLPAGGWRRLVPLLPLIGGLLSPQSSLGQTCDAPPTGLVDWWRAEGDTTDAIGTNIGIPQNGVSFATGEVGQAFSFNGVNQYITNPVAGLTNIADSYTMEFWAWPNAGRADTTESPDGTGGTSGQRYAIFPFHLSGGQIYGAGVSVGTNGISVFEHGDNHLASPLVYDAHITGWTHIAVVYTNQQPLLYVNGVLVRTGLTSPYRSCPSTCLGEIGVGYGYYDGLLDEVSIYSRPLTSTDVLGIYNAGTAGKCPPANPTTYPPSIIIQPASQIVLYGTNVSFSVGAIGSAPLGYQWKFDGTNLPGASGTSLILSNVPFSDDGTYQVLITNSYGAATSSIATLTVAPPTNYVTTLADSGPGSLRQVVASSVPGFRVMFATNGVVVLTNGQLVINTNVTIIGPGATNLAISGSHNDRVAFIASGASVTISGLTIRDGLTARGTNGAPGQGGGYNGGDGTPGGGIYNAGTLNLIDCAVSQNATGAGGNGGLGEYISGVPNIYGGWGGSGGYGAGICNQGTMTLTGCTISGNVCGNGGAGGDAQMTNNVQGNGGPGGPGGFGAGIFNSGPLWLTNCTIGNNALGASGSQGDPPGPIPSRVGNGGGVAGTATYVACTISGNAGDAIAGGAFLQNTIVSNVNGTLISLGHNLVIVTNNGITNGVNGDITGVNPMLSPLTNNGGQTLTFALLPASPAIDAGDDALASLGVDQRGYPRLAGAHVDIGAYEFQPVMPPYPINVVRLPNGAFQFDFTNFSSATFTVVASTNLSQPRSTWTVVGTAAQIGTGVFRFTDLSAASVNRRYYILRYP